MSQRYVVLLRGVNVGGRTTVAMPVLRAACEAAGCGDVSTYIQSGNVVLSSDLGEAELKDALRPQIWAAAGFEPALMVRTGEELADVISRCPYPEEARGDVHVAFLDEPVDPAPLRDLDLAPEELTVDGRQIYLYLPNGMGRARLPVEMGRRVPVPATVRNWRTVTRLAQMAAG